MSIRTIRKVIFCGGGIKCLSVLSAFKHIYEDCADRLRFEVNTWRGCSMGSVLCLMFVLNMKVDEIIGLIMKTKLSDISQQSFWTLFRNYGLDDGYRCITFIERVLTEAGVSPKITLETLHKITGKSLEIAVTNLNKQRLEILSHETHPYLQVSLAIRMSISFPFYFTPVLLDNFYYVDGGVIDNFPFDKEDMVADDTLGFIIKNKQPETKQDIVDYTTYTSALINTLFLSKEEQYWDCVNVVCVKLEKFYSVMSATSEERAEMLEQGRLDAHSYLLSVLPVTTHLEETLSS